MRNTRSPSVLFRFMWVLSLLMWLTVKSEYCLLSMWPRMFLLCSGVFPLWNMCSVPLLAWKWGRVAAISRKIMRKVPWVHLPLTLRFFYVTVVHLYSELTRCVFFLATCTSAADTSRTEAGLWAFLLGFVAMPFKFPGALSISFLILLQSTWHFSEALEAFKSEALWGFQVILCNLNHLKHLGKYGAYLLIIL